ncbi:MAG TPA: hypothetical protein VMV10_19005 [Pirellulales bacterium]|nr:hypothetical protein [Pirellulales bacterium]
MVVVDFPTPPLPYQMARRIGAAGARGDFCMSRQRYHFRRVRA